jgi:hypothetical protein
MKKNSLLFLAVTLIVSLFTYCKSTQKTQTSSAPANSQRPKPTSTTNASEPEKKSGADLSVGPMLPPGTPGDKELAEAKKVWMDATIDDLNKGRAIFYKECTGCHQAYTITEFTERKWKHEIEDMSPRAELSEAQKDKLTRYVLSYLAANTIAGK